MTSKPDDPALALMRDDLSLFMRRAFMHVFPGTEFQDNWHIDAVCHAVAECCFGDDRRLIVTLPPRSLKSFCISSALPAFVLGHDPTQRIICTAYGDDLVRAHARDFRLIVHSPWYRDLFPATKVSSIKDSETETVTTMGGGRLGIPMEGGITGRGGNLIIVDDPIKAQDCHSEAERERCFRTFTSTISTRVNNPAEARVIVTMQRLHDDDLVGRLLSRGGWTHLNIPAIAQEERTYRTGTGPGAFQVVSPGDLMHPNRLTATYLEEQRMTMGSAAFSAQFLQDPVPEDGEIIKRDWVRRYSGAPAARNYERVIQSWDTAVKTGANHDYSACLTVGILQGEVHVLDAVRLKATLHQLTTFAEENARRWSAETVLVEDANLGTELARGLLRRLSCAVIPIPPRGPKEIRVSAAAAQIEAGRLFLPAIDLPWVTLFEREMFAFPNGKNDDLVDALAQALNWYGRHSARHLQSRVITFGGGGLRILYSD